MLKEYAIRCRNVVFVIRQEDAYVRRFELPLMTEEQLRLNLPYEFHDYIGNEMDKYVFDYAMIMRIRKNGFDWCGVYERAVAAI
ncbi:MAG: hypothetical protein ACLR3S_02900 [Clostridium fessum]